MEKKRKKGFAPFLERLKELRGEEKQCVFAQKIGFSQGVYSRYETGDREPNPEILFQIAKNAGVSSDWLLGLTDDRTSSISLPASGGSVAANHSTVRTGGGVVGEAERARLLGIIESQQRVIESLAGDRKNAR